MEVKTDIKYRTRRRNQIATLKCNILKAKTEMLTFDKMHELFYLWINDKIITENNRLSIYGEQQFIGPHKSA